MNPDIYSMKIDVLPGITTRISAILKKKYGYTHVVHLIGKMMTLYSRKRMYKPFITWFLSAVPSNNNKREDKQRIKDISNILVEICTMHTLDDIIHADKSFVI